uniref:WSN domain-containing protein n=1 Tax=Caenorhabditis tropicalis TaxID=1561998 RepID=A0A1I7UFD6_9PELO
MSKNNMKRSKKFLKKQDSSHPDTSTKSYRKQILERTKISPKYDASGRRTFFKGGLTLDEIISKGKVAKADYPDMQIQPPSRFRRDISDEIPGSESDAHPANDMELVLVYDSVSPDTHSKELIKRQEINSLPSPSVKRYREHSNKMSLISPHDYSSGRFSSQYGKLDPQYISSKAIRANYPEYLNFAPSRVRRANSNGISTMTNNIKAVVHVVSGAHLIVELTDQSVPIAVTTIHVLRMGDVKPDDLTLIKSDSIKKAFDESDNLSKNPGDSKAEQLVIALDEMREDAAVYKNLTQTHDLPEYKADLEEVKGLATHYLPLKDVKIAVVNVLNNVDALRTKVFNESTLSEITGLVNFVYTQFIAIENSVGSFTNVTQQIEKAQKIEANPNFIVYILNEDTLRSALEAAGTNTDISGLAGIIQNSFADTKQTVNSAPGLKTLKKMIEGRDPMNRHIYPPGLPHDVSELEQLQLSVKNPLVVGNITDPSLATSSLERAFLDIARYIERMTGMNNEFLPIDDEPTRNALLHAISYLLQIANSSAQSGEIGIVVNSLDACRKHVKSPPPSDRSQLEQLQANMTTVYKDVNGLSNFKDMNWSKNLQKMKERFYIDPKATSEKQKEVIQSLLTDLKAGKFNKEEEELKNLKTELQNVLDFIEKPPVVNLKLIEDHQKSLETSGYSNLYTCLEAVQTEGISIRRTLELMITSRSFNVNPEVKKKILDILEKIDGIPGAVEAVSKLKTIQDKYFTALVDGFKDQKAALIEFVEALRGFIEVVKVSEVLESWPALIDMNTDDMDPEDKKLWDTLINGLKTIRQSINSSLARLDALLKNQQNGEVSFEVIKQAIDEISTVKGAKLDMPAARKVVDKLYGMDSNKYKDAKEAFKGLEPLNLDFSSYSIGKANAGFGVHYKFLGKYTSELSSKPSGNPKAQKGVVGTPRGVDSTTTLSWFDSRSPFESGLMYCGCAVVACAVVGGVSYCLCCKKKKDGYIPVDQNKDIKPPFAQTSGSNASAGTNPPGPSGNNNGQPGAQNNQAAQNNNGAVPALPSDSYASIPEYNGATPSSSVDSVHSNVSIESANGDPRERAPVPLDIANKPRWWALFEPRSNRVVLECLFYVQRGIGNGRLSDAQIIDLLNGQILSIMGQYKQGVHPLKFAEDVLANCEIEYMLLATRLDSKYDMERRNSEGHVNVYYMAEYKAIDEAGRNGRPKDYTPHIDVTVAGDIDMPPEKANEKIWYEPTICLLGAGPMDKNVFELVEKKDKSKKYGKSKENDKSKKPDESKPERTKQLKWDTTEKTWAMIDHYDVTHVCQLVNEIEKGEIMCAVYYPKRRGQTLRYGVYEVECLGVETNMPEFPERDRRNISLYKLRYRRRGPGLFSRSSPWKNVTIQQNVDFKPSVEMVLATVKLMNKYPGIKYIHCSDGFERTGVIACVKLGIALCQLNPNMKPHQIIQYLKHYRPGMVSSAPQFLFILKCIIKGVMEQMGYIHSDAWLFSNYFHRNIKKYQTFDTKTKLKLKKEYHVMNDEIGKLRDQRLPGERTMELPNWDHLLTVGKPQLEEALQKDLKNHVLPVNLDASTKTGKPQTLEEVPPPGSSGTLAVAPTPSGTNLQKAITSTPSKTNQKEATESAETTGMEVTKEDEHVPLLQDPSTQNKGKK